MSRLAVHMTSECASLPGTLLEIILDLNNNNNKYPDRGHETSMFSRFLKSDLSIYLIFSLINLIKFKLQGKCPWGFGRV